MQNSHPMPIMLHLAALRKLIIRSAIAIAIGLSITLYFSKEIFHILIIPLEKILPQNSHFITTEPFESYFVYFETALLAGILLSSPYLVYEIWKFISPGLYTKEKKKFLFIAVFSAFFFVAGAIFGYFVVFPTGFHFVVEILEDTPILFMPKMSDYFSFSSKFLLAFGIIFELPIFLLILSKMGLVSYKQLKQFRKYSIVLIFIIAAILTPGPDVFSQILMAAPLIVLYELGIILAYLFGKKQKLDS